MPCICSCGVEQKSFHLFFACPFSISCWNYLSIRWDLNLPPLDMMIQARTNFGRIIFRETVITACWNMRNAVIFNNTPCNLQSWPLHFNEEIGLVCAKPKPSVEGPLNLWKENVFYIFLLFLWALQALPLVHLVILYFFLTILNKEGENRWGSSQWLL